jgi:hypothetical protein
MKTECGVRQAEGGEKKDCEYGKVTGQREEEGSIKKTHVFQQREANYWLSLRGFDFTVH